MDNLVNSLVNNSVGKLTNQLIIDGLRANPNMSQQQLSQTLGVSMKDIAGALSEDAQKSGYQTTTIGNAETGQSVSDIRDIGGGFNAYQDENGQTSGFSRVDPSKPGMIQLYGPQGEFRGEQKITSTTQDMLRTLGPIALAAGGSMLAQGLLGAAGTTGGSTLGSLGAVGSDLTAMSGVAGGTGALTAAESAALYGGGTGLTAGGSLSGLNAGSSLSGVTGGSLGASNALLGDAALGSTLAGTTTGLTGTALGSLAGATGASSLLNAGAGAATSALGTTLGTGLAASALGNVLGATANQSGISDARDLINQYGTQAGTALNTAYGNAQNLNLANTTALGNNYQNLNTNLNNTINAQVGAYDTANQGIKANAATQLGLLGSTYQGQKDQAAANANALNANYGSARGDLYDIYNKQVGIQQPYQDVGRAGSQGLIDNQGYLTRQFTNADLNANLAPNYAFQLAQGQMANQRAANMGGGSLGGNALRGLQDYTQNYASGAYQNAFNNFNTQRQNIYSTLAGMANIGTTSGGQLASLGNTLGGNLGSLSNTLGSNLTSNTGNLLNAGNAYGSNTSSVTNSLNNALSSNLGQMQGAYNQYGSNLTGASNTYGGNLTTGAGQGINAANIYGANTAGLATGIGSALAGNATAQGANTATALSNLGNTALLGSMLKAT